MQPSLGLNMHKKAITKHRPKRDHLALIVGGSSGGFNMFYKLEQIFNQVKTWMIRSVFIKSPFTHRMYVQ